MSAGTKILHNQFSVQNIVEIPCPPSFYNLLNITVKIYRSYDTSDGVANVNEYGEIVMKPSLAGIPSLIDTVKARINAKKGEGLITDFHGKSVMADFLLFVCPAVDCQENDEIEYLGRKYLVIRVDEHFNYSVLHHKQVYCKEAKKV